MLETLENYLELTDREKLKKAELELKFTRMFAEKKIKEQQQEISLLKAEAQHWQALAQQREKELERFIFSSEREFDRRERELEPR